MASASDDAALAAYDKEDRVVSSGEIRDEINRSVEPRVKLAALINDLDDVTAGFHGGELVAVSGPPKSGKCHGKGTPILMYDGTVKPVEEVLVGDKIMGDDSTPRTVLALGRGREMMYRIKQNKADDYTVNKSHILSLKVWRQKKSKGRKWCVPVQMDIPLTEYFNLSKTDKQRAKGYKAAVDWPGQKVDVDPYFLGLWLGDGDSRGPTIITADDEIVRYLYQYAREIGHKITRVEQPNNKSSLYRIRGIEHSHAGNRLLLALRGMGVLRNKHIPMAYKVNSRAVRLAVLAGLVDSDGSASKNGFDLIFKSKALADDTVFLARSLGFRATVKKCVKTIKSRDFAGTYYRIAIYGDVSQVPCLLERKIFAHFGAYKRNPAHTGITVEETHIDDYYGFTLDGNGRYLLGDFTVTHNTLLCQTLTVRFAEQGFKSLWFTFEVPMRQFLTQVPEKLEFFAPKTLRPNDLGWMLNRMRESVLKHDCKAVFIDHLHYVVDILSGPRNLSVDIGKVIRSLKTFANDNEVVVFILCHSTKCNLPDGKQKELGVWDLRDSSFVPQEADTTFIIQRTKDDGSDEYGNRAQLKVCNHRRTGVMEKKMLLYKRGGILMGATDAKPLQGAMLRPAADGGEEIPF